MAAEGKNEGFLDIPWLPMAFAGVVMTGSGVYGLFHLGAIGLLFIVVGLVFLVWSALALAYRGD